MLCIAKIDCLIEKAASLKVEFDLWSILQTVIDITKVVKLDQNTGWISK